MSLTLTCFKLDQHHVTLELEQKPGLWRLPRCTQSLQNVSSDWQGRVHAGGGNNGGDAGGNGGSGGSSGSDPLMGDDRKERKKLAPVSITLVSFAVSRKAYTKVIARNRGASVPLVYPWASVSQRQERRLSLLVLLAKLQNQPTKHTSIVSQ